MGKCRCILEFNWFCIDDSFGESTNIKGGEFPFQVGEEYDFHLEDTFFGKAFLVTHPQNSETPIGFDEIKFSRIFKVI
jgi:hypothetical protein